MLWIVEYFFHCSSFYNFTSIHNYDSISYICNYT